MFKALPTPSQKSLLEILDYDPSTGALIWRERPAPEGRCGHHLRSRNTRWVGKRAGGLWTSQAGYRCRKINIFGRYLHEHRVIWKMVTGEEAGSHIDHINGDPTDNRWENLRSVSAKENSKNVRMLKNNTSGVTGVFFLAKYNKWAAHVRVNRKKIHLGIFGEIDEAAMAVMEARLDFGFTSRHGIVFAPPQRHPALAVSE
jgi:hypothetical protein